MLQTSPVVRMAIGEIDASGLAVRDCNSQGQVWNALKSWNCLGGR